MTFIDDLLAGPRGRRLLLEFAVVSEKLTAARSGSYPLSSAVFEASYHLDPDKDRIGFFTRVGDPVAATPPVRDYVAPETVAAQLASLELAGATPELLRQVLQRSVEEAMYWQPPMPLSSSFVELPISYPQLPPPRGGLRDWHQPPSGVSPGTRKQSTLSSHR